MLLSKLLLLPVAVASTVTVYVHSLPSTGSHHSPIPSPIPLAQINYDAETTTGTLSSYTPPTGSYSPDHLLRVGLGDIKTGHWRGVLTSGASFKDDFKKKITLHIDEKGEPYHVGFSSEPRGTGDEVEVEVVKREAGPKPALNRPIVLNAEGKLDDKEPEKTFLQKYELLVDLRARRARLTLSQVLVGYRAVPLDSSCCWRRRREMRRLVKKYLTFSEPDVRIEYLFDDSTSPPAFKGLSSFTKAEILGGTNMQVPQRL